MQSDGERKARMRAYYAANKHKWKKYNRDTLTRMSEDERTAYNEKQREYAREYYQKHREEVIERTSQYNENHKDKLVDYRAKYFQLNKQKITARQRQHYHKVVKPRQQKAKETTEYVSVSGAVAILGAKLRAFREWVYQGRIDAVRTPGGRYLLRRADVEQIKANTKHIPEKIRMILGLSDRGNE